MFPRMSFKFDHLSRKIASWLQLSSEIVFWQSCAGAKAGWLDDLDAQDERDHLTYWPPPTWYLPCLSTQSRVWTKSRISKTLEFTGFTLPEINSKFAPENGPGPKTEEIHYPFQGQTRYTSQLPFFSCPLSKPQIPNRLGGFKKQGQNSQTKIQGTIIYPTFSTRRVSHQV